MIGFSENWQWMIALVFFGSILVYSFHRINPTITFPKKDASKPYLWVSTNKGITIFTCFMSGFLCVVSSFYLSVELFCCLLPILLVTLAYILPIVPTMNKLVSLKELPLLKIWVIAFVVSYITVFIPFIQLLSWRACFDLDVLFLFFERVLFLIAITIPFDVRDVKRDRAAGVHTLPIELGVFRSLLLSVILLGFVFVLVTARAFLGLQADCNHVFLTAIGMLITAIVVLETNPTKSDYFFSGLVESTIIIYALTL